MIIHVPYLFAFLTSFSVQRKALMWLFNLGRHLLVIQFRMMKSMHRFALARLFSLEFGNASVSSFNIILW